VFDYDTYKNTKGLKDWHRTKVKLNKRKRPDLKEGEVWWCALGLNIGTEQDGDVVNFQRPVIILKKFSGKLALIAPLTNKKHIGSWYIGLKMFNKQRWVICNQIRPIDTRRLLEKMGQLPDKSLIVIKNNYFNIIK
jgi:mRNA interferase MazF